MVRRKKVFDIVFSDEDLDEREKMNSIKQLTSDADRVESLLALEGLIIGRALMKSWANETEDAA